MSKKSSNARKKNNDKGDTKVATKEKKVNVFIYIQNRNLSSYEETILKLKHGKESHTLSEWDEIVSTMMLTRKLGG